MISIKEIKKWKILPFEKLTLSGSLDAEELLKILDSKIVRSKNMYKAIKQPYKSYIGFIAENKFKIRRIPIKGYIGFLPIAEGNVIERRGKTEILVKIKFDNLQIILFALGFVFFLFEIFFLDTESIIISAIVYIILIAFFNDESKFIKDDLKDYFNAELIDKDCKNIHQHKNKNP